MAPIIIYGTAISPPVRAVWLASKALNLEWEHKEVNLLEKQQLQAKYIRMNPQHTVPVLDDNGVILWDSHAIMAYLAEKYEENGSLYPKNLVKRAIVDQRMHFDTGVVFPFIRSICIPMLVHNEKSVTDRLLGELHEMYGLVNTFLEGNVWICGDDLTIADFALLATITTLNSIIPVDSKKNPNIARWIKRAESLPYFNKGNAKGVKLFQEMIGGFMKKFE